MAKLIHLTQKEYDYFIDLLISCIKHEEKQERLNSFKQELLNAVIVDTAEDLPLDVVNIGSLVEYEDMDTGVTARRRLLFPVDADEEDIEVSVLAPVGMALIGHQVGDEIAVEGLPKSKRIIITKLD